MEDNDDWFDNPFVEKKKEEGMWYNHKAEEEFSFILRDLKQPGLIVSDIDFILYSTKTKNLMILDHKIKGSCFRGGQEKLYELLDNMFKLNKDINYIGCYQMVFSNETFGDSREVWLKKPFDNSFKDYRILDIEHLQKIIRNTMSR